MEVGLRVNDIFGRIRLFIFHSIKRIKKKEVDRGLSPSGCTFIKYFTTCNLLFKNKMTPQFHLLRYEGLYYKQ